jgi:mono/diheme cytochrome c family protein
MNAFPRLCVPGLLATGLVVVFAVSSAAQETKLKKEPVKVTSPASGREMFVSYCAPCHGQDAKGDGPAAAALKTAPADLTTLAKRNNGKYPDAKVASVLRWSGDSRIPRRPGDASVGPGVPANGRRA